MGRILGPVKSLTIDANVSPCAHICRYCSVGDRGPKFPLERWMTFVERFLDWRKGRGGDAPDVQRGFVGPSFNFEIKTYATLRKWYQCKVGSNWNWLAIGGLKMRGEEEMRRWLSERQGLGLEGVKASFTGHGAVHDRWNGRHGDFDFLMRTLRTAAEIGLGHSTTLFLTKSSLPLMDELVDKLDALPTPHKGRHVCPYYYIAHGAHHEAERITEEDRENLTGVVTEGLGTILILRSEREWIESIRGDGEAPTDIFLHLELNAENVDRLEAMSCDEIFADLEARARASLATFPSLHELADTYGDRNGTKIYMFARDLDRMWLDRFLGANPIDLDRQLLHYHLGRSLNPPPLWK
ncbi:MAG: hypothetical protein ACLP0B_03390 [Steroidobacteraceae bacterium]